MDSQKARAVCFCPCYRICYYTLNIILNLCHLFLQQTDLRFNLFYRLELWLVWYCAWNIRLYRFFYNDSSYNMTKDRNIWHRLNVSFSVNLVKLIIEWSIFFTSLSWKSIAVIQLLLQILFPANKWQSEGCGKIIMSI